MEIFMGDEAEKQFSAARRCGAWLGHFQMKGPQEGHLNDPGELLLSVRYWAGALRDAGGPLAAKADLLLRKLEAAVAGAPGGVDTRGGDGRSLAVPVVGDGSRTWEFTC